MFQFPFALQKKFDLKETAKMFFPDYLFLFPERFVTSPITPSSSNRLLKIRPDISKESSRLMIMGKALPMATTKLSTIRMMEIFADSFMRLS